MAKLVDHRTAFSGRRAVGGGIPLENLAKRIAGWLAIFPEKSDSDEPVLAGSAATMLDADRVRDMAHRDIRRTVF
jgi:hypothetical protein